jgi:hypothetical protein
VQSKETDDTDAREFPDIEHLTSLFLRNWFEFLLKLCKSMFRLRVVATVSARCSLFLGWVRVGSWQNNTFHVHLHLYNICTSESNQLGLSLRGLVSCVALVLLAQNFL